MKSIPTLETAVAALISVALVAAAHAQGRTPHHADMIYASAGGRDLALDLYLPELPQADGPPPLVVWIHGGGWRAGSKASPPSSFVDAGFALASLDFRQSTEARFPAMVHDIKAAIRFLRAHAPAYRYDASRVAIAGASSGGHLAALVGVSNGHEALEGTVGDHLDQSSDVQAILVYFGASNLTTILQQSTPAGLRIREPALELLLGGTPDDVPDVARLASPVFHVGANAPPLHMLHGDQDVQMPINQSHELQGVYKTLGLDVTFDVVHGAPHGGPAFYDGQHWERAAAFLRRILGQ
jgi:acetyl esterase/lipase